MIFYVILLPLFSIFSIFCLHVGLTDHCIAYELMFVFLLYGHDVNILSYDT